MVQAVIGVTRTDLTSGETADGAWKIIDLGPDDLNLVPDEGCIGVIIRWFGNRGAGYNFNARGMGSTDFDDGSPELGQCNEDWGQQFVPVPDSGANANNDINVNVSGDITASAIVLNEGVSLITLTLDGATAQVVAGTIDGDTDADATLVIDNSAGVTFSGIIGGT